MKDHIPIKDPPFQATNIPPDAPREGAKAKLSKEFGHIFFRKGKSKEDFFVY